MARAPRPILKTTVEQLSDPDQPSTCLLPFASCSQSQLLQHHAPHVHFPPTPHLARMEITHSPNTYDRAPIVVVPNDCAIPDRGCRSYGDGDRKSQSKHRKRSNCTAATPGITPGTGLDRHQRTYIESYFHPRAFEASASFPCITNAGIDREEAESESPDMNHSLFAALPSSLITTTASWTPPLTRCSSPLLPSSPFASSSDQFIPVPLHSQLQFQAQQSKSNEGPDTEETLSMAASTSTAPLNTLTLTLLPYLPPSSSSSSPSPKSLRKKKGAVAVPASPSSPVGENDSGRRRRSRDLDCLAAYTRCSPFRDPALDGCLGGF